MSNRTTACATATARDLDQHDNQELGPRQKCWYQRPAFVSGHDTADDRPSHGITCSYFYFKHNTRVKELLQFDVISHALFNFVRLNAYSKSAVDILQPAASPTIEPTNLFNSRTPILRPSRPNTKRPAVAQQTPCDTPAATRGSQIKTSLHKQRV